MKKMFRKMVMTVIMVCLMTAIMGQGVMAATITINGNETVTVTSKTFKAYKVMSLSKVGDDGYVYDVDTAWEDFFVDYFPAAGLNKAAGTFDVDVANLVTALSASEVEAMAEAMDAYVASESIAETATSQAGAGNTVNFGDTLASGYYLIVDTTTPSDTNVVSAVMLNNYAGTDVVIDVKADMPSIEKKIWEDTDATAGYSASDTKTDTNTASLGDKVNYVLNSKVPDVTGYDTYTYRITDTLSDGLTFNGDVVVIIGGRNMTKDTEYTLNTTANGFTVEMDLRALVDSGTISADQLIVVTYTGTVNENAVIGTEGNPNTVNLTYSNDPGDSSKFGTTPDDIVKTYVTQIKIAKVDENDSALTDAEFKISGDGVNVTKEVDGSGFVVFSGLGAGDYDITEIKAPSGYVGLVGAINVSVGCTLPGEIVDGSEECTWTYTLNGSPEGVTSDNTGIYTLKVVNKAGSILPGTGGIGTVIFVVVGCALIGTAALLLAYKKKADTK